MDKELRDIPDTLWVGGDFNGESFAACISGFAHTRERFEAAFPILLSISASKERLALMAEPRYVNWQTNSSSYSPMVMTCSASVSCPTMFVFFRLIVSPESLLV